MGTPDESAAAAGAAMFERDRASQALGMALEEVRPGYARLSMTVRADMVNGHGTCHGGLVFALADSAFAFACNTTNQRTVAQGLDVVFLAAVQAGAELEATAVRRAERGRSGVYDVTVRRRDDGADEIVAELRGQSRTISGTILSEE